MNEYIESCQREKRTYDEEGVRQAVRLFLKSIGEDPEREGLVETPDRIARACRELFAGLQASPADVLEKHFDVDTEELVLVKDIELYSVCEHHLLPFHGVAHVGYIPAKDGVMGLSKLARLVEVYARRPQGGQGTAARCSPADCDRPACYDTLRPRRDRGDRMRASVHVDARHQEILRAHGDFGGARHAAQSGHPGRSHEPHFG